MVTHDARMATYDATGTHQETSIRCTTLKPERNPLHNFRNNAPAAAGTHQATSDPARDAHYTETGKEPPSQLPAAVHK